MKYEVLTEGLPVYYEKLFGKINFVCNEYVTILIREFPDRSKNVNIIVYHTEWHNIKLSKESEK